LKERIVKRKDRQAVRSQTDELKNGSLNRRENETKKSERNEKRTRPCRKKENCLNKFVLDILFILIPWPAKCTLFLKRRICYQSVYLESRHHQVHQDTKVLSSFDVWFDWLIGAYTIILICVCILHRIWVLVKLGIRTGCSILCGGGRKSVWLIQLLSRRVASVLFSTLMLLSAVDCPRLTDSAPTWRTEAVHWPESYNLVSVRTASYPSPSLLTLFHSDPINFKTRH